MDRCENVAMVPATTPNIAPKEECSVPSKLRKDDTRIIKPRFSCLFGETVSIKVIVAIIMPKTKSTMKAHPARL